MKFTRVVVLLGVLVVAGSVAGFEYWGRAQRAAQEREVRAAQERKSAELADRMIGSVRVVDDYAVPRNPNEQHDRILEQVRQAKSQFIVFPPSAPKFRASLDLTARIAIAREIARRIEGETGVPVPDPAVVFEAYDAPRRIDVALVQARLMNAQAQWLISGTAWHDARGKMSIRLVKIPVKSAVPAAGIAFERAGIEISDELPPEAAFRPLVGDALRGLGFKGDAGALIKEDAPSELPLPPSPAAAETMQATATEGLWLQQLIGVLHHPLHAADPRPRERVFERTLSGLESLSPESGDYAVLMARSLLYVGRPFAAARILEPAPATPEAKALMAYLKADLPALKSAVAEIRREIPRTIAECELVTLRVRFGELDENDHMAEEKRLAKRVPPAWQPLLALFVAHQNLWTMPVPSELKPLLDRDFPVEGYRIEDLVRGKGALGASPADRKTAIELIVSPLVHSNKWRAANAGSLCCEQGSRQWTRYDRTLYLDLLDAMAEGELAGRVVFLRGIQGRPEAALSVADEIDAALYHGSNSQIIAARLEALWTAPPGGTTPARDAQMRRETGELAKKILSWDSAQSNATGYALQIDSRVGARGITGVPGPNGLPVGADSSMFDFPRRSDWAWHAANTAREPLLFRALTRDACRLSTVEFYWCEFYLEKLKVSVPELDYRKEVAELVEPRFIGSPWRATLLAGLKQQDGDLAGAEQLLASAIAAGARQKDLYSALGYLQLNDGRYAQAAETFLAFPGLKRGADNTVGLSSYLEEPAYSFSGRGAMPQASQLFKIVASYRDGSFANLSGVIQYAFLEGRYEFAREMLREQYQHYHNFRSARRLASLLFMMGESENAWSVLKMAQTDGDPSKAGLVGMRVTAADVDRIAAWTAAQADDRKNYWRPLWETLELMCEDRSASGLRQIYEVDAKARRLMKSYVVQDPLFEPKNAALLAKSYLPEPAFVEGYAAIKERKYPEALSILEPLFTGPEERYTNGSPRRRPWQLFPYLALAAAKTTGGDRTLELIQQVKGSAKPRNISAAAVAAAAEPIDLIYLNLALAIGHAFKGDHARAEAEVQKARAAINGINGFLAPGYAFVEILERLDEETRHPAYMAIAMEYVRAYQRYEPWQAWPYAFEARHAPPGAARIRAAAIALKLDPQSQWLHELDNRTMEQARQWAKSNPWPAKDSTGQPVKGDQT